MRLALGLFLVAATIVIFSTAIWLSRRPGAGDWIFGWGSDVFTLLGISTLTFGVSHAIYYVMTVRQWPHLADSIAIGGSAAVLVLSVWTTFRVLTLQRVRNSDSSPESPLPLTPRPAPASPPTVDRRRAA
jgi:hypothetical protein